MVCPDCKGRRRIVLLTTEEDCGKCGATGAVPDAPFYPDPLGVGKSTCQFAPGINLTFNKPRKTNREIQPAYIDRVDGTFVYVWHGIEFRSVDLWCRIIEFDSINGMRYYLIELIDTYVPVNFDLVVECRDSLWIGRNYTFSLVADAGGRLHTFAQESP